MWTKNLRYFVSLNAIKLTETNLPKEKALIIHHGMLGSARNLRPLCKNSRLLNYVDVLLVDARNHGQSPHTGSHSVEDMADDLLEFIEKESPNYKNFTVLGHSMGGLAVMEFTRKFPQAEKLVQRIVIVDIPCCPNDLQQGPWDQQSQLKMLKDASNIDLTQNTQQIFKQIDEMALDKDYASLIKFNVRITPEKHIWRVNLPVIIENYKEMVTYSLQNCEWKGPVQVIYGSESDYFEESQIESFMKQYPQMEFPTNFHKIQGAGHWVHFDKKQAFLETVEKIIKRNE